MKNFLTNDWLSNAILINNSATRRVIKGGDKKKEEDINQNVYITLKKDVINSITSYNNDEFNDKFNKLLRIEAVGAKVVNIITEELFNENNSIFNRLIIFNKIFSIILSETTVENNNFTNRYNTFSESSNKLLNFMFSNINLMEDFIKNNSQEINKVLEKIEIKKLENFSIIVESLVNLIERKSFEDFENNLIYQKFIIKCLNEKLIDKVQINKIPENLQNSILHQYLNDQYLDYSQLIHSNFLNRDFEQSNISSTSLPALTIFYNHKEYESIDSDYKTPENAIMGNPLAIINDNEPKIPIGYTLVIPKGDIDHIIFDVYGGSEIGDEPDFFKVNNSLYAHLLNHKVAIVKLFMIDYIESAVPQIFMTQLTHDRIHKSIDRFYNILKYKPQDINILIQDMSRTDFFIFGQSFGGRTAVKHMELYPQTFKGAISFAGGLKLKDVFLDNSNNPIDIPGYGLHSPSIENIEDNLLIIHNLDDNRVPIRVSLDFISDAKAQNKFQKIDVCFLMQGESQYVQGHGITSKGHLPPANGTNFQIYSEAILKFLNAGISKCTSLKEWRLSKVLNYSNKDSKLTNFEEKFISEAYNTFKKSTFSKEVKCSILDSDIAIYKNLYLIELYKDTCNNNIKLFENEIERLKDSNILTNELIIKAIKLDFDIVKNYLIGRNNLSLSNYFNSSQQDFSHLIDEEIVDLYRNIILEKKTCKDNNIKLKLIAKVYKATPDLLLDEHFKDFSINMNCEEKFPLVMQIFLDTISEEKEYIKDVWKHVSKEIIYQNNNNKLFVDQKYLTNDQSILFENNTKDLVVYTTNHEDFSVENLGNIN